jgi:peptidoglycan/LPS O-acetylase OafA/YrhL
MTTQTSSSMHDSLGVASQSHRRDIQGLRAVAVLVVVAFHAGLPFPGGFTGVDMFFVISGFVITGLLLRERARSTFTLLGFYARRAKRLLPALAVMTAAVLVLSLLFESPISSQVTTSQTAIGAMLLVANYVIIRAGGSYFDPVAESNPLLHTWSLSVEEQFYLVFPALLIAVLVYGTRRGNARQLALAVVAVISVVSFGLSVALSFNVFPIAFTTQQSVWAFYAGPTRVWEFGLGAMLCLALARPPRQSRSRPTWPLAALGIGLLSVSVFWISDTVPFPGFAALLPTVGIVLLIWAGSGAGNVVSGLLASRPMVAIGDASYSIYLWHWPLIVFAVLLWPGLWTAILAACVSFIPAWLSYRYIETPCRRAMIVSALRTLTLNVIASLAVIGIALAVAVSGPRLVPYALDAKTPTVTSMNDCLLFAERFQPSDIERCTFRVENARGWILLAGDSHADSYSNAIIESANDLGFDVTAILGGRCPFIRDARAYRDIGNCSEMNAELFDLINSVKGPDLVVLAQSDLPPQTFDTVTELQTMGVPILYLRDFPRWRDATGRRGPDPCSGGIVNFECEQPRSVVEGFSASLRGSEAQLLADFPEVRAFDPWPLICDERTCSPVIEDRLGYQDDDHLNAWGSAQLQPYVYEVLRQELGTT